MADCREFGFDFFFRDFGFRCWFGGFLFDFYPESLEHSNFDIYFWIWNQVLGVEL